MAKKIKLTKTQEDLLAVLRAHKETAEASEAEADARAIGGLSLVEKFRRKSLLVTCGHVQARGLDGKYRHARGVKHGTWNTLEDAGLAVRGDGNDAYYVQAL